jgi:hypothetical protein
MAITRTDSLETRNWERNLGVLAPIAWRRPISLVRSRTELNMMFMMPMPPTTSESDATAASIIAMMLEDASCAANSSCRLRIGKSSSSNTCRWCR